MKNLVTKISAFLLMVTVGIVASLMAIWAYDAVSKSNKSVPQTDSTVIEQRCDTITPTDTTQIYVYETDSCCKH